jgi:hypothetical protein
MTDVLEKRLSRFFWALLASALLCCLSPRLAAADAPSEDEPKTVAYVQRLIGDVLGLPRLERSAIERVLGASLGPSPSSPDDPDDLEAQLATGPFASVSFRAPNQKRSRAPWILILEVREGLKVQRRAFPRQFLGSKRHGNVCLLEKQRMTTYQIDRPGGSAFLKFEDEGDTFIGLTLRRDQAGAAPR